MPTYEYRPASEKPCGFCSDGFDFVQRIADAALASCPECGQPVRRIISAPAVATSNTSLAPENLEKHGFTQYRRAGKGTYEKTAGKGPDKIES